MPIHDWTRVQAGIFHDFHHAWIEEIKRSLNTSVLPGDYYAMAEQHAAGFGPDVLTLQGLPQEGDDNNLPTRPPANDPNSNILLLPPKVKVAGETQMEFYRRKQTRVAVRHVSGDRVVAMIEVVSPGNKSTRNAMRSFVEKAGELLDERVHLLFLDVLPPGPRDPNGIHGEIWDYIAGEEYQPPADRPLTLVSYESGLTIRAYLATLKVGDVVTDMPLFLDPGAHVAVPLGQTYDAAFQAMPRRWRRVLDPTS
jgi:hypothetical protein